MLASPPTKNVKLRNYIYSIKHLFPHLNQPLFPLDTGVKILPLQNGLPKSGQKTTLVLIPKQKQKKKKTLENLSSSGSCHSSRPNFENKSEKINKYVDLKRELKKKMRNMKVTVTPFVIGALGTVSKVLKRELEQQEIRGSIEIIQTTTLIRPARILRRVLETRRDLLSLGLQLKPTGLKSQMIK